MTKKKEQIAWRDRFLSPEEVAQKEAVFTERFISYFKSDENISIEGYFSQETLYITLSLANWEQTYYYPVSTSISLKDNPGLTEEDARLCLLDFIGEYFDEFFNTERGSFLPIDWTPYSFDGKKMYAKGQIINKKLEKEADDILKSAGFKDGTNNEED